MTRDSYKIRIGKAPSDGLGSRKGSRGSEGVAGEELLNAGWHQKISPFHAVGSAFCKQASSSLEPAVRLSHFVGENHAVADEKRETRRAAHVVSVTGLAVAAGQHIPALRLVSQEVSRHCEAFDVVESERFFFAGGRVGGPGLAPLLPVESVTSLVEVGLRRHAAFYDGLAGHLPLRS